MEHIIYSSTMDHLKCNKILIQNQHGFKQGYSCETQLISLVEDILHGMYNQRQVDLILLDFSKAFDKVPHQCHLTKVLYYGINGDIYRWISLWSTQRLQRVILDGVNSDFIPGVLQGTVYTWATYVFNLYK